MDWFIKSQAEIDREKRIKTALGLANRAMRPGTQAEGEACEQLLKKHQAKYKITDEELLEFARKEARGGRKEEQTRQEQRQGSGTSSDGFYYRDQRDRKREAEDREEKLRKQAKTKSDTKKREEQAQFEQWKAENKRRANEEWNERFEKAHGKPTTRSGWRPENRVSEEEPAAVKAIKFINSLFGV